MSMKRKSIKSTKIYIEDWHLIIEGVGQTQIVLPVGVAFDVPCGTQGQPIDYANGTVRLELFHVKPTLLSRLKRFVNKLGR